MIRRATPADYPAIAQLQIASWRDAYVDQLPKEYLGQPVVDDVTGRWTGRKLAPKDILLVSEASGQINGFALILALTPAYVDNLHVLPEMRGQGIGSKLLKSAARALITQGRNSLCLTVITTNYAALGFYEALGGVRGPERAELMYQQNVAAYPIVWNDLSGLADLGG